MFTNKVICLAISDIPKKKIYSKPTVEWLDIDEDSILTNSKKPKEPTIPGSDDVAESKIMRSNVCELSDWSTDPFSSVDADDVVDMGEEINPW